MFSSFYIGLIPVFRGKGDKYKHKSEVVSYDSGKDQTIKRKTEAAETTPAKKVKKEERVKEEPSEESMEVTTEETPTKSKKVPF